jgi:hypothetical protein
VHFPLLLGGHHLEVNGASDQSNSEHQVLVMPSPFLLFFGFQESQVLSECRGMDGSCLHVP